MVEYFPFVIVPNGTATRDLRNDKPFLFAAILMAASRQKIFSQPTAGNRLMEYMSVHMLQNGEKSLDWLQGLLDILHGSYSTTWELSASITLLEVLLSLSGLLGAIINIVTTQECPICSS